MKVNLNGAWKWKEVNGLEWLDAVVPGSVMNDLLRLQKITRLFLKNNYIKKF